MVMTNKNMYVNGSSALNVNSLPNEKNRKYKELDDFKREHLKRKKEKKEQRFLRMRVYASIALTFTMGYSVVHRYSSINKLEKTIIETKAQINNVNAVNEDLKIELLKYKNISSIEEYAVNDLNMECPTSETRVFADLSKDNFIDVPKDDLNVKKSFIDKIKSIFISGGIQSGS